MGPYVEVPPKEWAGRVGCVGFLSSRLLRVWNPTFCRHFRDFAFLRGYPPMNRWLIFFRRLGWGGFIVGIS